LKDLTWYFDSGAEVTQDYFANPNNHFLAYRIDGTEFGDAVASVYIAYNGWSGNIQATIPMPLLGNRWFVVADTSSNAEEWGNIHSAGEEASLGNNYYLVNARSLVLLIER
jgi:glycogen operon protein